MNKDWKYAKCIIKNALNNHLQHVIEFNQIIEIHEYKEGGYDNVDAGIYSISSTHSDLIEEAYGDIKDTTLRGCGWHKCSDFEQATEEEYKLYLEKFSLKQSY